MQAQLQPFANLSTGKCRASCPGLFSRSGDRVLGPDNGKKRAGNCNGTRKRHLNHYFSMHTQPLLTAVEDLTLFPARGQLELKN